jgi:hypothetical protein
VSIRLEETAVDDTPNFVDAVAENETTILDRDRRGRSREVVAVEVCEHDVGDGVGGWSGR